MSFEVTSLSQFGRVLSWFGAAAFGWGIGGCVAGLVCQLLARATGGFVG